MLSELSLCQLKFIEFIVFIGLLSFTKFISLWGNFFHKKIYTRTPYKLNKPNKLITKYGLELE